MREAIGTGETVELAKEAACKELGVESYEAEFEILELPTKKTFGLFGGSPAKVRVYMEDDPASIAAEYLKNVLSCMGIPGVKIEIKKEEGGALLVLEGDNIGFVIGHRGETLDALQYLSGLVANHVGGSYYRIALDIGNYREKRRQTLETLGKKIAEKSLRTARNCSLEPMNPYERRIIHTAVQTVEGAKSWSEGQDLERHVVIGPINGERYQHRSGIRRRPPYRQQRPYGRNEAAAEPKPKAEQVSSPQAERQKPRPDAKGPLYDKINLKK